MKYQKLYQRAKIMDCDTIVTGHYARIEYDSDTGRWLLKKARNLAKDQSYVLYFMTQEQLKHTKFPLGDFASKDEVRNVAAKYGFINAKSMTARIFVLYKTGNTPILLSSIPEKAILRVRLWICGAINSAGIKDHSVYGRTAKRTGAFFAGTDVCLPQMSGRTTVVLSSEKELYTTELIAEDFNWIVPPSPEQSIRVTAKVRYGAKEAAASASVLPDQTVRVMFDEPQRAVTKGQAVVLYDGDIVMGGGTDLQGIIPCTLIRARS